MTIPRVLLVLLVVAACGQPAAPPAVTDAAEPAGFDRAAMLAHLAHGVLQPPVDRFAATTPVLATAIAAGCDDTARAAWRDAIDDPSTRLANVRSLAAIEYLLFHDEPAHTCALAPNGWDQLGADLPAARCGLAGAIASDVDAAARQLAGAWRDYPEDRLDGAQGAGTYAVRALAARRASGEGRRRDHDLSGVHPRRRHVREHGREAPAGRGHPEPRASRRSRAPRGPLEPCRDPVVTPRTAHLTDVRAGTARRSRRC